MIFTIVHQYQVILCVHPVYSKRFTLRWLDCHGGCRKHSTVPARSERQFVSSAPCGTTCDSGTGAGWVSWKIGVGSPTRNRRGWFYKGISLHHLWTKAIHWGMAKQQDGGCWRNECSLPRHSVQIHFCSPHTSTVMPPTLGGGGGGW